MERWGSFIGEVTPKLVEATSIKEHIAREEPENVRECEIRVDTGRDRTGELKQHWYCGVPEKNECRYQVEQESGERDP